MAPPNPTRDTATLVTDTACSAAIFDPTGMVTLAFCGAVVHHDIWWLPDRPSTKPAAVSEGVNCSMPDGFDGLRPGGPSLEAFIREHERWGELDSGEGQR